MSDPCQNCGNPDADLVSFDMDLPNVRMCPLCSMTITMDRELFDQMGDAYRRRQRARTSHDPLRPVVLEGVPDVTAD